MLRKKQLCGRLFIAANLLFCSSPILTVASETGHDWYCPEPDAHEQYMLHMKKFHTHDAESLADRLASVYGDTSLNEDQKKNKAVEIVNNYLQRAELGKGD